MASVSLAQIKATEVARGVLASLGVTDPFSADCPECGTECLADPETPYFVCGHCGNGPFEKVEAR